MVVARRPTMVMISLLSLALAGAGCTSGKSAGTVDATKCQPYSAYLGHRGGTVSVYSAIRDVEADLLRDAWKDFVTCTGITISYEGTGDFEAQIKVRVDGGNAPDLAFFPQPGLLERFAKSGRLKPAPGTVRDLAATNWSRDWQRYGTVGGVFYAAPLGSNVKSYVWYSPKMFRDRGYPVPKTWAELMALTAKIADTGIKPWCVGIESGEATGWPATDWIEDLMLRDQGPEVYDQWVTHQIAFNDPKVRHVLDLAGQILKNEKFVNGGYGGVKSIATTSYQEAGQPLLTGKCAMHRQASFYSAQFPRGTRVAQDGDVYAFYFPSIDPARGRPVLGGGEFVGAFADRPEVKLVQAYLASVEFANSRARRGSWVSANKGLNPANVAGPIDQLSVRLLQDPATVFRFDGSDLMPAAVGAGTFWKGMTDWINGKDAKSTLDYIESAWTR